MTTTTKNNKTEQHGTKQTKTKRNETKHSTAQALTPHSRNQIGPLFIHFVHCAIVGSTNPVLYCTVLYIVSVSSFGKCLPVYPSLRSREAMFATFHYHKTLGGFPLKTTVALLVVQHRSI